MRKEKPLVLVEDKQRICDLLLPVLQATRGGSNLVALEYENDKYNHLEFVTAKFRSGGTKVADVTADSGIALIYDVMRQIF